MLNNDLDKKNIKTSKYVHELNPYSKTGNRTGYVQPIWLYGTLNYNNTYYKVNNTAKFSY